MSQNSTIPMDIKAHIKAESPSDGPTVSSEEATKLHARACWSVAFEILLTLSLAIASYNFC